MKIAGRIAALFMTVCMICAALPAAVRAKEEQTGDVIWAYGEVCAYAAEAIRNGTPDENGQFAVNVQSFGLKVGDLTAFQIALFMHFPDLFYISNSIPYSYAGDSVYSLYFTLTVDPSELEEKKARFEEMANELCALRDERWSDLETVLFFSDYLAAHYAYDMTLSIYDAYNFLEQKTGVCQAYTATFQLLMNRFGIPCTYAYSDNIGHIWNVVQIGGAWYHLDITHNDPAYDRPGAAHHTYTLTGSETTYALKSAYAAEYGKNVDDMAIGADVAVSLTDCPLAPGLRGEKSAAPVVWTGSGFYTITQDGSEAQLVRFDFEEGTADFVRAMPRGWRIPESSYYYTGNYSTLVADGRFLYYFDSYTVYGYDTFTEEETELASPEDGNVIYGLIDSGDGLIFYTGKSPGEQTYSAYVLELPTYTITWVIGDETFTTTAKFGRNPLSDFNGSTEREDEDGVAYIFIGWSPEVVPATEDVTYTALYDERRLYIVGDVNGDGTLNINDVTALLNALANGLAATPASDTDGDGVLTINDVTALLDLIASL